MRQREVLLLTLGLVLASLPAGALPSPPAGPYLPHAPIVITENAHFNASNGVVAGTGAPGSPFVIQGWAFATAGTAIRIDNVTAAFLILENQFDAGIGVHITRTTQVGVVENNQFIVRGTGVLVANADAHIVDNSFLGNPSLGANGRGVVLVTSNSVVESNAFMYLQFGVHVERGSPRVLCNDIHDDVVLAGVYATLTTNATISCNIITQCTFGIKVEATIGSVVTNNTITSCFGGVRLWLNKDITFSNNTIRFTLDTQLYVETTSGNITGNVIIDGRAQGVVLVASPVLFANNTIHNNINIGLAVTGTADIHANVVSYNSLGIQLVAGAVVNLTANVMSNNSVGIDIPYESRQTIVNMSANIVNGVNIDGTINASQQVYFYKRANVTISGQIRDSGFSAGFYGSLTAQGGIVLYEVNTVNVNATVIAHHTVGVGIVNAFNVNVNNSLVVSNTIGIRAEARAGVGVVPPCVVSAKNVNITIPVDPVATVGIDLKGCLGIFANITTSVVDVGIRVDGTSGVTLLGSTFVGTKTGADIQATPNMTNISGNAFVDNRVGVRLSGTVGIFRNNTVQHNAEIGVRLENSAQLAFENNNVSYNGVGVLDMEACAGSMTCSSLKARSNTFFDNRGDAVHLQGYSTWRGDVAIGNEGSGFVLLGSATINGINASHNERDGARIQGSFEVDDSSFFDNDDDGLDIVGDGELTDTAMVGNEGAGLRVRATSVSALRLNISYNFDGIALNDATAGFLASPNLPPPSLPNLAPIIWSFPTGGAMPLDIHRSVLMRNERDAIRGGNELVDASHNYFGRPEGPSINFADTIGAFQNGVTPGVRFLPYYTDADLTTTGPLPFL